MLVESISRSLRDALTHIQATAPNAETEAGVHKFLELLEPHAALSVDDFTVMLSKVKKPKAPPKPKKTPEEKLAEADAKAAAKVAAKQAKDDEKAAAKIKAAADKIADKEAKKKAIEDAKLKAAADKIADKEAKKKAIEDAKIAKKDAAEAAKIAKKYAAAAAKLANKQEAEAEKQAKKQSDKKAKSDADFANETAAVETSVGSLRALLQRFKSGNVPEEAVDAELAGLKTLNGPQLFRVAQAVNSDATLTESTPKAKILKQISEMVMQVWKTSDNVNH